MLTLVSQGQKPLEDFFQHHQPLLWSLLALYAPFVLSVAIAAAWIGAGVKFGARPQTATALAPILLALLWVPVGKSGRMMRPSFDFLCSVRPRQAPQAG